MVKVMYCKDDGNIYVIHSPMLYETGVRMERLYNIYKNDVERWFKIRVNEIIRVNTGTEWGLRKAEEIRKNENCDELRM